MEVTATVKSVRMSNVAIVALEEEILVELEQKMSSVNLQVRQCAHLFMTTYMLFVAAQLFLICGSGCQGYFEDCGCSLLLCFSLSL